MAPEWVRERRKSHGAAFREELRNWLVFSQSQSDLIVEKCILLLDEDHLLSLPLPPGVVLPSVPGPRNFRFLFRRQIASLLQWKERRVEGDSQGFSDKLNSFVRDVWWPDERAEALHGDSGEYRQLSGPGGTLRRGQSSVAAPETGSREAPENCEIAKVGATEAPSPATHLLKHRRVERPKVQPSMEHSVRSSLFPFAVRVTRFPHSVALAVACVWTTAVAEFLASFYRLVLFNSFLTANVKTLESPYVHVRNKAGWDPARKWLWHSTHTRPKLKLDQPWPPIKLDVAD